MRMFAELDIKLIPGISDIFQFLLGYRYPRSIRYESLLNVSKRKINVIQLSLIVGLRGDTFKRYLISNKSRRGINRSRKAREDEQFKEKRF